MNIKAIVQPSNQLGNEIDALLNAETAYARIVFVSAFVALRTILRLRDRLLEHVEKGTRLRITVGIDLGGTSREVLEELLRWNCEIFVFHNPISRATFHPKIYLFQNATSATLFIGSNNLTDGGFYTNYEAATRYHFDLPLNSAEFENVLEPLKPFIHPDGPTVRRLDDELIRRLLDRGELQSEAEARQSNRKQPRARGIDNGTVIPDNPFRASPVPIAPLLPPKLRAAEPAEKLSPERGGQGHPERQPIPQGVLVWKKILTKSDALQVKNGSHHVGGVRLTQAKFENSMSQRIDQTTYFRQLFVDYSWEHEPRSKHLDQEHTFVPMRIIIRGQDYGNRNFEISHKPSGEAGQDNYTTILRWGREFNPVVVRENLTGAIFSLFEVSDGYAGFLIEITDE